MREENTYPFNMSTRNLSYWKYEILGFFGLMEKSIFERLMEDLEQEDQDDNQSGLDVVGKPDSCKEVSGSIPPLKTKPLNGINRRRTRTWRRK